MSGSGPAYVFLLAEAMIDAGARLTRAQASEMAVQTIRGAGILLSDPGLSAVDLRAAVTSPGGTTAEAIREFEANGLRHVAQATCLRGRQRAGWTSSGSRGFGARRHRHPMNCGPRADKPQHVGSHT